MLISQIESFLPQDRREQVIFRLYYRQGLTAKEIASIPAFGLSVKGVESVILRITNQIRERIQKGAPMSGRPGLLRFRGRGKGISSSNPS